jgi:hypothetical protein
MRDQELLTEPIKTWWDLPCFLCGLGSDSVLFFITYPRQAHNVQYSRLESAATLKRLELPLASGVILAPVSCVLGVVAHR